MGIPSLPKQGEPARETRFFRPTSKALIHSFSISPPPVWPPHLFGHNLEHTRASIMDGLSAQMIRNRKFVRQLEERNGVALDWEGIGECVYFANEHRLSWQQRKRSSMVCHYAHNGMWRRNECQVPDDSEPNPESGERYQSKGAFPSKGQEPSVCRRCQYSSRWMCVALTNADGTQIYAETVFPVQPVLAKEDAQEEVDEWQRL